ARRRGAASGAIGAPGSGRAARRRAAGPAGLRATRPDARRSAPGHDAGRARDAAQRSTWPPAHRPALVAFSTSTIPWPHTPVNAYTSYMTLFHHGNSEEHDAVG